MMSSKDWKESFLRLTFSICLFDSNEEYGFKFRSVTKVGQTANTQITVQNGLGEKNLLQKYLYVFMDMC